mgnify:CR=1 FL=1
MSKPIKLKSTVKKFQKSPPSSSLNMTIYEKDMIMSNLLNVLFNQVKLQQEVRNGEFTIRVFDKVLKDMEEK